MSSGRKAQDAEIFRCGTVNRLPGEDHYTFEIIDLHAGDDYKVIEIEYTRQ